MEKRELTFMIENRTKKRKKKRKTPFKRFLRYVVVTILFLSIIGLTYGGYLAYTINKVADNSFKQLLRGDKSSLRDEAVKLSDNPVTILLMGVDDYQDQDKGRTDVLMLLALNPKTKKVAMLSIPRDTKVYLPLHKQEDKINAAYAYDDIEGTVETVQNFLNVPVDYYIKTGVKGFKDVIDSLGGIDVNVPFDFKQVDLDHNYVRFYKGPMHLTGRESLAFVQNRHDDPEYDFGRQKREQEVLNAIADQALSLNTITKANHIIETIGSNVQTNISIKEFLGLRNFYKEIRNNNITKLKLEGVDSDDGNWYFLPHENSVKEIEHTFKDILEIKDKTAQDDQTNQNDQTDNNN